MPRVLRMPEVAADTNEAVLAEWLVPENAGFEASDAIATVETEKALVDIEADGAGVVLKTLVLAASWSRSAPRSPSSATRARPSST